MRFGDDTKRQWRETKAAIKRGGNRSRRRALKEDLVRNPDEVGPNDEFRFGASNSSREMNAPYEGRGL